jgi:hypothetical protein
MTRLSWSRLDGADCIRLPGLAPGADVQVRPATAGAAAGIPAADLPPMAGRLAPDGAGACFVPRFGFVDGTAYAVTVDGQAAGVLARPRPARPATAQVLAIHPAAGEVPRNLLRCYLWFSAPMSEGQAAAHVRLTDDAGTPLPGALLPAEHELWDGGHRRLTVLLDPARIKRGLAGHREAGYPLRAGQPVRLVVGAGFRDAAGTPLRAGAERRYTVGPDERRRVEPGGWTLTIPAAGGTEPLRVTFGRPLDHGLLARCLHVTGPDGLRVDGTPQVGPQDRSWQLVPGRAWPAGTHQLVIDPVLEDLAGNSVSRVFDRDLSRPEDNPAAAGLVTRPFQVTMPFQAH